MRLAPGAFKIRFKVWDRWVGSIQDPWYASPRFWWPLEARRSLFPDWLWLCDESSPHRRALHILVQILAGKFKMEFLLTVGLTKAFPARECFCETKCLQELHFEFSRQNLNRNVPIRNMHIFLGSRSERGGARRAPTKRVCFYSRVRAFLVFWLWNYFHNLGAYYKYAYFCR